MKWIMILIYTGIFLFFIAAGIIFYAVFYTTPRMKTQKHIRSFEAHMPLAPAGSIPVRKKNPLQDGGKTSTGLSLADTREREAEGAVYYGYYCVFCHGENGDGGGPVGDSYMPKPADLRARHLNRMSDEELLRAILFGTGHEPVINRVVPPDYYDYLVLYVRSMSRTEKE